MAKKTHKKQLYELFDSQPQHEGKGLRGRVQRKIFLDIIYLRKLFLVKTDGKCIILYLKSRERGFKGTIWTGNMCCLMFEGETQWINVYLTPGMN